MVKALAESGLENDLPGERVRVFIVDDSPMMCKIMERIFSEDPEIEVVGKAMDSRSALEGLSKIKADVCTLDVQMPGMNGITLLKHIMIRFPLPALMVSAFTVEGSNVTYDALRYGAVDFFQKPSRNGAQNLDAQKNALRTKVKRAARVRVGAARYLRLTKPEGVGCVHGDAGKDSMPEGVTVIVASTGGYSSLLSLLPSFGHTPREPIIVLSGISGAYLEGFVSYLQEFVPVRAVRAREGSTITKGSVYFLAAEEIASLERAGDHLFLHVTERPNLSDNEGPADLLLYSASENFGPATLAVFLSGDGTEGVSGAQETMRLGGRVMVQRPDTCLSSGLPQTVIEAVGATSGLIPELSLTIQDWAGA